MCLPIALPTDFSARIARNTQSFAGLMLGYRHGDAMNMQPVVNTFGITLTTVDDYARAVLGIAAPA